MALIGLNDGVLRRDLGKIDVDTALMKLVVLGSGGWRGRMDVTDGDVVSASLVV